MQWLDKLKQGVVIPAHPLALTAGRKLDERRQRALTRYYKAAGAGGVAVGVHTTQFAIRDPKIALYRPVLELAMDELRGSDLIKVAGVVGGTQQAVAEAEFARGCGYDAVDLATTFRFGRHTARIIGGLLGHWSVWTSRAVELLERAHKGPVDAEYLTLASQVTDSNAALFDPQNNFAGCIAGLHEVLRRQGLLQGTWCLDPKECLSPGQAEEIDRIYQFYPHLTDDQFVAEHRDAWLR